MNLQVISVNTPTSVATRFGDAESVSRLSSPITKSISMVFDSVALAGKA